MVTDPSTVADFADQPEAMTLAWSAASGDSHAAAFVAVGSVEGIAGDTP